MKYFKINFNDELLNELKFLEPELDWIDQILGKRKSIYEKHIDHMADSLRMAIDCDIMLSIKEAANED